MSELPRATPEAIAKFFYKPYFTHFILSIDLPVFFFFDDDMRILLKECYFGILSTFDCFDAC